MFTSFKNLECRKYFFKIFLTFIIIFLWMESVLAQSITPPKGLVVFRLGYRSYVEQSYEYDREGDKVSLGDPFYTDVNLSSVLSEVLESSDKSSLLNLLNKLGIMKSSLVDQNIGYVSGDVRAHANGKYLGVAFGITDNLGIMVASSLVNVDVNIKVDYEINEDVIKPLGGLVVDKANESIKANIKEIASSYVQDRGYESLDNWSYSGWGDTRVSILWGKKYNLKWKLFGLSGLDLQLMIPTGYKESSDILQDTNIERGYYHLSSEFIQKFGYNKLVWLDSSFKYGYSFATTKNVRVPETGSHSRLISKDRTASVEWKPGNEIKYAIGLNGFLSFIHPKVEFGYKKHFEDEYSKGSISGNYSTLSSGSESEQTYTDMSLEIDTTELYLKKMFLIPFMFNFSYHLPLKSKNIMDERYLELSFQSFIPTPMFRMDSMK